MHGERRGRWFAGLFVLALVLLVGTLVGVVAYNAGVSHGLALGTHTVDVEQGARAALPPGGYPVYYYGWHPWGFGFGFLGPLLFLAFWFFIARMLFWGGMWRRHAYRYRGGWGCYGDRRYDPRRGFDEWHRGGDDRMGGAPPTAHI